MTLPAVVAIGVFGLFHPQALEVEAWGASRVEVGCAGRVIEGSARVRITSHCVVSGVGGGPVDFVLSVPGKIRRHYQGVLRVRRADELFAVVTMACAEKCNIDLAKVNVNGGAVALGHPNGASGARVLTTLVHAMAARGAKRGLATLCIGGGEAIALVVER